MLHSVHGPRWYGARNVGHGGYAMRASIVLAIFGLSILGCHGTSRSNVVSAPAPVAAAAPGDVESGTVVVATLLDPMSTLSSRAGDDFTAQLDEPLLSKDGRVVIPAGSVLRGRVVTVDDGTDAQLDLVFDAIDTLTGTVRLEARLIDISPYGHAGSPLPGSSIDARIHPPIGPHAAVGGGPRDPNDQPYEQPRQISIPKGARMQVLLLEPLRR